MRTTRTAAAVRRPRRGPTPAIPQGRDAPARASRARPRTAQKPAAAASGRPGKAAGADPRRNPWRRLEAHMRRWASRPRPDWQRTVESQGLVYHSPGGGPYWDETAYYEFTSSEIDQIERASYEVEAMCQQAVAHVIANNLLDRFQVPEEFREFVADSWYREDFSLYGRFDFAFDGRSPPKLLEYNADTPTSLPEAAVIQWFWLKDCHGDADQFNSIHERLIEAWRALDASPGGPGADVVYFAAVGDNPEDFVNVSYLRDTCTQAGWKTRHIRIR